MRTLFMMFFLFPVLFQVYFPFHNLAIEFYPQKVFVQRHFYASFININNYCDINYNIFDITF